MSSTSDAPNEFSAAPSREEAETLDRISKMFTERLQAGQFDDLTIREVRVKAAQETEKLMTNDVMASVVSVIVYIVWT